MPWEIVIVGRGFGGIHATRPLEKILLGHSLLDDDLEDVLTAGTPTGLTKSTLERGGDECIW